MNVLIVLGLVFSGLAPFCVTKTSGKIFLEICTANGIELIALDSDNPNDSDPQSSDKTSKTNCSYCITTAMGAITPDLTPLFGSSFLKPSTPIITHDDTKTRSETNRYEARAPPCIV